MKGKPVDILGLYAGVVKEIPAKATDDRGPSPEGNLERSHPRVEG